MRKSDLKGLEYIDKAKYRIHDYGKGIFIIDRDSQKMTHNTH